MNRVLSVPLSFGAVAALAVLPVAVPPPTSQIHVVGTVTDSASGAPIANARVTIVEHRIVGSTDDQGDFDLTLTQDGLAGSRVTIRVAAIGYSTATRVATIANARQVRADFALVPSAVGLDEIVVSGQAVPNQQRALGNTTIRIRGARSVNAVTGAAAATSSGGVVPPRFNRESYAHIVENAFHAVVHDPMSTFSIDVDRASYSNVRRFIEGGSRPPIDAVRVEEMINYFPYGYPDPEGEHPFSVTTDVMAAPWNASHRLVRIGLQTAHIETESLPPSNLVFLIDVSGSMMPENKLPLIKRSLALLVDQLRPQDRVAMVVYAGNAGLVLPSTSGAEKRTIRSAIRKLAAGGSTAGGAGIKLAYDVALKHHVRGGNNRVILATDGDFNVGASSDAEMIRLIEEKREQGTFLTVLGFGTGNIQDAKMEQIADHGNGNFAYIDNLMEARKVLITEMGGTLLTVAKDVKIQVEFNPARVRGYRLVGYENRLLADEDFNDDTKDAGEIGAGHSVTALYEIIPVGVESSVVLRGVDALRYQTPRSRSRRESEQLMYVKLRYKEPDGQVSRLLQHPVFDKGERESDDFVFAAAVAGFGMLLRDSEHCRGLTLDQVLTMARRSTGDDPQGYRAEFVRLVAATRDSELLQQ